MRSFSTVSANSRHRRINSALFCFLAGIVSAARVPLGPKHLWDYSEVRKTKRKPICSRMTNNNTQTWSATLPPTSRQRWSVFAVAALLVIAFGALAPFAGTHIQRFDPFVPLVAPTISITNLITSILLFAYFYIYRSAKLLVLASGYLFTALIVIANALTIPGVFAPTGLLGAGLQTAAWLYCIWHTAFPAALLIYAWLRESERGQVLNTSAGFSIGAAVAIIFGLTCGLTLLAIQGDNFLPRLMENRTTVAPTATCIPHSCWVFAR